MNRSTLPRVQALLIGLLSACGKTTEPNLDSPLPVIRHLGISIAEYDSATNKAGDITFAAGETFIPFGKLLEGDSGLKRTPELTWFVEEGTPVRAPLTGLVSQIDLLYSGDNLIILRQPASDWEVGVEHVIDPLVQVGDEVEAGQIIATATPETTPVGTIAFTELAVWLPADTDEEMIKMCPYLAFDPDLKQEFAAQILALAEAWEAHWGADVFDQASWTQPGCVIDEMTEAEGRNPSPSTERR